MQTTNAEPCRRTPASVLAPAMALLLLSVLAVPASAQRGGHGGRGGSGHHGQVGGHSGHRGGGHAYGSHRSGRSHGSYAYGHHSGYPHQGNRGHHGYYAGYGSRGHYGHGGYSSYRGYRAYSSYYRGYLRPYGPYFYYGSPGAYGFGYHGYPGVSIRYDASPTFVVAGKAYPAPSYYSAIAIPERVVTESGEPISVTEPYDARLAPARLKLKVEPGDASVYLDGRFLGLASELPPEIWIDPGSHRLEVARPGFADRQLDLELEAGEALDVDAGLEAEAPVPDLHR